MSGNKIHLGYRMPTPDEEELIDAGELDWKCGDEVFLRPTHLVVTGLTQEAGKTTTLEKLSEQAIQADKKVVVFLTKKDEGGFQQGGTPIKPYFKDEVDWEYVAQILESAMKKSMDFEEAWIINAVEGDKYPFLEKAETLQDVSDNISELLERHRDEDDDVRLKGLTEGVFTRLDKYLDKVVPKIQEADLSTDLNLHEGVNVMDLRNMDRELQALIIGKTIEKIYEDYTDTIPIMPEAWKFLPQGTGSPCKDPVETFIREAAGQGNYMWIDSQDITGVDKQILKQVNNWIMGYQREKNEVERTRDQMPLPKKNAPGKEQVMSLKIGEFFLCDKEGVKKVYVDPVWMHEIEIDDLSGEDLAKAVACGKVSSEDIKWARKDQMEEKEDEETEEKTREEDHEEEVEERSDTQDLERKVSQLNERTETLRNQVERYEEDIDQKDEEVEQLKERIDELNTEIEELEDKNQDLEDVINNKDDEIERLRNSMEEDDFQHSNDSSTDKTSESPIVDKIKQNSSSSNKIQKKSQPDAQYLNKRMDRIEEEIKKLKEQEVEVDIDTEQLISKAVEQAKEEIEVKEQDAPENVEDLIKGEYHQSRIQDIVNKIDNYSSDQKKLLLFSETTSGRIDSKKSWVQGALGWDNYGGRIANEIDELVEDDFVDKRSNKYYKNLKELIEDKLSHFNPSDEEVNATYQKALSNIKNDVDL